MTHRSRSRRLLLVLLLALGLLAGLVSQPAAGEVPLLCQAMTYIGNDAAR